MRILSVRLRRPSHGAHVAAHGITRPLLPPTIGPPACVLCQNTNYRQGGFQILYSGIQCFKYYTNNLCIFVLYEMKQSFSGAFVNTLIRPLCAALEEARQHSRSRAKLSQREVDRILQNALRNKRPSWPEAFAYARAVVVSSFHRPAVHVAAVAILVLVLGSGIFIPFGSTDILTRLSLISVAMAVGTSLSFLLLYLFLPLHLRYRVSHYGIAAIHTVVSAVVFCLIEPEIIRYFQAYTVPEFSEIFLPILLLYGMVDLFVLWQFKNKICMRHFERTHKQDSIETLLPTEKRGEVWLMSAADHYVEFTSEQGTHLRRMTMKAAVEKVPHGTGLRVHRSHWVAYSAMLSMEKDGERYFLILRNGKRVPVSPKNTPKVKCYLDANCQQAAE